jgi:hypothetical protein
MDGAEHNGMPEVPGSCGEVDGLQSRKCRILGRPDLAGCELTGGTDDLLQVQATFLLPLWVEGSGEQPV